MAPRVNEHENLTHSGTFLLHDSPRFQPLAISETTLERSRRLLYLSHFFNQFSENSWQFCLVLFLAAFSNYQSLVLVCSYGLVSAACVCYFGSAAGRFIDGTNRLVVAQRFIGYENCAVLLATLCCYMLLSDPVEPEESYDEVDSNWLRQEGVPTDPWSLFLLFNVHILGAGARILDAGFLVAVERDWIVVMSKCAEFVGSDDLDRLEKQKEWLSETNVAMKQIDLSCKVVAPAIAGVFVAFFDDGRSRDRGANLVGAALFVGILNVLALIVEYMCTAKIYHDIPSLALKRVASAGNTRDKSLFGAVQSGDGIDDESLQKRTRCYLQIPEGLKIYLDQEISWAGIGLSLLYLNVLTFGGIMTAYLVWRGMRLDSIGFWRGISSAAGLAGTFVYHFMARRMSLIQTGMWSVVFQFLCLSLSYASLFMDDFSTSLAMLIAGVCASRVGLWVFDISVTQLMQLHIPEDVRGLVGGVQQSLNAFFGMLSFALGILIPNPEDFHYYVSVGYASVALALLCYALGVYARRQFLSFENQV